MFLLNYVQQLNGRFADLVARLPAVHCTPEIRIDCSESRKFALVDELKQHLKALGKTFNDIDGVRVEEPHGWWLVRASNTQSALSVRAESDTAAGLQSILTTLKDLYPKDFKSWAGEQKSRS